MNGRYHVAETPEDRIAIAVIAAERKYRLEFPQGVTPGQVFYADFLRPFIERELLAAKLAELHKISAVQIRERERELANALAVISAECQERINL